MSEKNEWRIVRVLAVALIIFMVAFGVHQYIELKQLDRENYGIVE